MAHHIYDNIYYGEGPEAAANAEVQRLTDETDRLIKTSRARANRAPATPKEKDRIFSNFIGLVIGGLLLWHGITNGFGFGELWNFAIPIITAVAASHILGKLTIIIRPLRWLAMASIWFALIYGGIWLYNS